MEILAWIKSKLEPRPLPFVWGNPADPTEGMSIVIDGGQTVVPLAKPEPVPRFGIVHVDTPKGLTDYLGRYADQETTAAFAGVGGITAICDYTADSGRPAAGRHRVVLAAKWSPDCDTAMRNIESKMGKWISLDEMDCLLELAAPLIESVMEVRGVLLDLEGKEVVSVKREATKATVTTGAEVSAKGHAQIPSKIKLCAWYLGGIVQIEIPLRVRVDKRAIEFQLVENGSITAAKTAAALKAQEHVQGCGWFVVGGKKE